MHIDLDLAYITTLLLLFIRLSASLLLTPLFSITQIPIHIRILFVFSMAVVMVAGLHLAPTSAPHGFPEFLEAALYELFIGALMAFGLFSAFGVFLLGGRILDFQMGFGVASLIDPATRTQAPLIGTILNITAVMTFFMLNGHHILFRGIAYSLEEIPLGSGLSAFKIDVVISQFGRMFVFGLMIVAPAVMSLFLVDVGLAIIARTMPQVNIFIVGLPLKIFVGSMVFVFSLQYMSPLFERVFESLFRFWEQVVV
jgi:flagellar biosynthetic protein FliR